MCKWYSLTTIPTPPPPPVSSVGCGPPIYSNHGTQLRVKITRWWYIVTFDGSGPKSYTPIRKGFVPPVGPPVTPPVGTPTGTGSVVGPIGGAERTTVYPHQLKWQVCLTP
jgi:hypothetical protein